MRRILSRVLLFWLCAMFAACDNGVPERQSTNDSRPQAPVPTHGEIKAIASEAPYLARSDRIEGGVYLYHLAYSPDGKYLAVGTGRTVEIRDASNLETLHVVDVRGGGNRIAWEPNSKWVAAGTRGWKGVDLSHLADGEDLKAKVHLIDPKTGTVLRILHGAIHDFYALAVSDDGTMVAGGGAWERKVFVWDLGSDDGFSMIECGVKVRDVMFLTNELALVCGEDESGSGVALDRISIGSGEVERIPDIRPCRMIRPFHDSRCCWFLEKGNNWVGPKRGDRKNFRAGILSLVTLDSFEKRKSVLSRFYHVRCSDITHDGRLLALDTILVCPDDGILAHLQGTGRKCMGTSFSPDSTRLALGGAGGQILIWDLSAILEEVR